MTEFKRRFAKSSTALDIVKGVDLHGRTVGVTGTTNGIGIETARALAHANAHVVMFCRNVAAAEELKKKLCTEKADAKIDIIKCDMASLKSVKAAADEFKSKGWPLHVLILNAGGMSFPDSATVDGFEIHIGVNHIAGYYLTTLLVDTMAKTVAAHKDDPLVGRLIYVASEGHRVTHLSKSLTADQLTDKLLLDPQTNRGTVSDAKYYGTSKLCNVWTAGALARKYKDKGINAYSLHPGVIATNFAQDSGVMRFFKIFTRAFGKSIEQGAATTVYCATAEELKSNGNGGYFADCFISTETDQAKNIALQDKLLAISDAAIAKVK
jgi:NAD(P)-dependent dehydrogenase (short-subunit alcohol dehydrogenase family)